MEQQFFSCKPGSNVYNIYGNKVNNGLKSFGVTCSGAVGVGGRWRVLGPASLPSTYHYSWAGKLPTASLTVYKWLDPALGYFVVSSMSLCTSTNSTLSCRGFVPLPKCTTQSDTCIIETTTAPAGQFLNFWYFKTILNSVVTPETPGNLLEVKASWAPFTAAPVPANKFSGPKK